MGSGRTLPQRLCLSALAPSSGTMHHGDAWLHPSLLLLRMSGLHHAWALALCAFSAFLLARATLSPDCCTLGESWKATILLYSPPPSQGAAGQLWL